MTGPHAPAPNRFNIDSISKISGRKSIEKLNQLVDPLHGAPVQAADIFQSSLLRWDVVVKTIWMNTLALEMVVRCVSWVRKISLKIPNPLQNDIALIVQ